MGSGHAVSIRKFVEMVRQITKSKTKLMFGTVPYRENEIMLSQADMSALQNLGWQPQIDLRTGIKKTIEQSV